MLPLLLLLSPSLTLAAAPFQLLNVWPYPANVTLGSPPTGPLAVPDTVAVDTAPSCDAAVAPLFQRALGVKVTFFAPARTYAASVYAAADAWCPAGRRCEKDGDCTGACVSAQQPWNSTHLCNPFADGACGCCVATPLPSVTTVSVGCNATIPESPSAEAYTLTTSPTGAITIEAASSAGASRAAATLAQLLRYDPTRGAVFIDQVPLHVVDFPKFDYRGLLVDTSRHFVSVDALKSVLRGMHALKMTPLHWHIVDSPSFPYNSTAFPRLAAEGSWTRSPASSYSQDDVAAVVGLAASLYVDVVFEVDTPAHTMAWGRGHPEIMTDCAEWMADQNPKTIDRDDTQAIDPTSPASQALVYSLLAEVASLSPSPFVHVGGDEVKTGCWNASSRIREYTQRAFGDTSDLSYRRLQVEWTKNVSVKAVTDAGKRAIVWQSTPAGATDPAWNASAGLPASTVYMAWLNAEAVATYAKAGMDVVSTIGMYVAGATVGSWPSLYKDPMPANLTAAEQRRVLGGQVCVWGETMTGANVAQLAFQVGGSAAEALWSENLVNFSGGSQSTPSPEFTGVLLRLNRVLCHLQAFGVVVPPASPSHCSASLV